MQMRYKLVMASAAVVVASAASFPNEVSSFYLGPTSWQKREQLSMCQQTNSTFISFLASDRDNCLSRLRIAAGNERTGLWSRHDRGLQKVAQAER